MLPNQGKSHGTQPPPSSATGHPLPRRASPENSVTLRHHKLARDASLRASPVSGPSGPALQSTNTSSPRRQSSDESQDTGHSDAKKWFDHSNENPAAALDGTAMDVDPPFFQRESDSSNEEKPYHYQHLSVPPKLTAQSSSAEDYRSVIDDLTIEIQRLKEELRRYKQPGPDLLRKDKLFEIKVHGLPKRKKRELEAKLRDFAATLDDSQGTSSSQKKKNSRHHDGMYSASGSMSKHASSSSGSNLRPADSAYASMSTGANSSGTSLTRPTSNARSNQKVENYLRDIPEGLYPRRIALTDKERKRLVVRRLEQLFTGKIGGRHVQARAPVPPTGVPVASTTTTDIQTPNITNLHQPPTLQTAGEPAREAQIVAPGRGASGQRRKKSSPDENTSNSRSNQTDSRETGNNSSSSGTNTSPPEPLPEQRPTRIKDLDPDRVQIPSENMDYIRHLGLVPPELLEQQATPQHVHPDADGWVYLNLLCNLAQLHMMNVTSDFVRSSVLEMSTKFQLSPDGQKIRWRGGTEGTNFSSDNSGYSSQQSPSTDDTDGSNPGAHKRQKTDLSAGKSGSSRKNNSKNGQQVSSTSDSFHYKPLFVHQSSSNAQMSPDDTTSSYGPIDDSNAADSRWDLSGSGTSMRRKRRRNGAIIYYSGAPFCTDLSGDPGDLSPTAQMVTNNEDNQRQKAQSPPRRTYSGSFIDYRPLTDKGHLISEDVDMDMDTSDSPGLITDNESGDSSDFELEFGEANDHQYLELQPLEPCGLGGVLPDDHFMVVVTTRRSKVDAPITKSIVVPDESTDAIVRRLATMSTSSPVLRATKVVPRSESPRIEIEYISGRIKRLQPVQLPPPAIFFPPFCTDDSSTDDFGFESESVLEAESSEELRSRRANPHHSDGYPDGVDLSSGDEEGDEPDDSPNVDDSGFPAATRILPSRMRASPRRSSSAAAAAGTARRSSKSASADVTGRADASSAATAGGAESGYNSSDETS